MHGWRLPPRKIYFSFKTMKNIKIADPVSPLIVFTTNNRFCKKQKGKIPVRK